jgi:hypothetical protein
MNVCKSAIILEVRTSPVIGQKAWFGPRRIGWGLGPVSPEGWALTAVFSAMSLTAKRLGLGRGPRRALYLAIAGVVLLKGTSPGGPAARRTFEEHRSSRGPASEEPAPG